MCGRFSDRQHDLTSEGFLPRRTDPEVTVLQPHTLLPDSTATRSEAMPPSFERDTSQSHHKALFRQPGEFRWPTATNSKIT
jgi:hypothetical protein